MPRAHNARCFVIRLSGAMYAKCFLSPRLSEAQKQQLALTSLFAATPLVQDGRHGPAEADYHGPRELVFITTERRREKERRLMGQRDGDFVCVCVFWLSSFSRLFLPLPSVLQPVLVSHCIARLPPYRPDSDCLFSLLLPHSLTLSLSLTCLVCAPAYPAPQAAVADEYAAIVAPALPDVAICKIVPGEDSVEAMVTKAADAKAVLATHGTVPAYLSHLENIRWGLARRGRTRAGGGKLGSTCSLCVGLGSVARDRETDCGCFDCRTGAFAERREVGL